MNEESKTPEQAKAELFDLGGRSEGMIFTCDIYSYEEFVVVAMQALIQIATTLDYPVATRLEALQLGFKFYQECK